MRVGIYASVLNNKLTGIGRYVYELCRVLPKVFPDWEFILISKDSIKYNPFKDRAKIIVEQRKFLKKLPSSIWFRYFSAKIINELDLDFLWCSVPLTPMFLKTDIKKVVTVYDFNLYVAANTMSFKTWLSYKLFFDKAILEADRIITISNGTADKLEKIFKRKANAIIRPAVSRNIFKKLDVKPYDFRYILSVATIEPRKNMDSLIEAFVSLKKEGKLNDVKLVLVGISGWKNKNIIRMIEENKENIIYTGYISDENLVELYNGAEVFVFPSIYEGFGIPVLEARSCGCCVITTDIPELREACGEGCIYIKPDVNSIKIALESFFKGKKNCIYEKEHTIDWFEEAKKFTEVFM